MLPCPEVHINDSAELLHPLAGCRGTNALLERMLDEVVGRGRETIQSGQGTA